MTNEAKILIGIGVATLAIVIGAALTVGGQSTPKQSEPIKNPEVLIRSDSSKQEVKGAKVTLVEFGDYQCPACGAANPTVKQILSDYKGKITFAYRQFPLPIHKNAKIAAEAAEAAGAQGKFFEMHDKLYSSQAEWSESGKPMDHFTKYAKELKLDVDKFTSDVENKKFEAKIKRDTDDGFAAGVNATPTFFINNVKQEGGLKYEEFKKQIELALEEKK